MAPRERMSQRASDASLRGLWSRVVAWQSPYSVVTSMLACVLALVVVSDLLFGASSTQGYPVVIWLLLYIVAALLPLLLGRRFPRWGGILLVALIESWSIAALLRGGLSDLEISSLLELPMVALYLGWFYRALVGRILMAVSVIGDVALLIAYPGLAQGVVSVRVTVAYALLFAVFCFEGARALRRQGYVQSITDPLTGALNRRGLEVASRRLRRGAESAGESLVVVAIDFDDFRSVNEQGGHGAGDDALRGAVASWQELLGRRRSGLIARLGGDEFALLLRGEVETVDSLLRELKRASSHSWTWGPCHCRGKSLSKTRLPGPIGSCTRQSDPEMLAGPPESTRSGRLSRGRLILTSRHFLPRASQNPKQRTVRGSVRVPGTRPI
ncbi:GGDEF domain-containing protein [Leucobacter insecticola]|uniref:GGDEF domain-containing protein n=1 Tax=Leucobacter insecticola TaxID=2714934 RepID=A0A6G8FJ94_9MICO|nr:GGDEF domain-containing protein [Leucobacter insecticola]QIM16132.1 GGDEF domain-containing protein [Leucobacter insecticola]